MSKARIRDIYAGKPDAKDENNSTMVEKFFESFIVPPELRIEELLQGEKTIVSGNKGVGKTSVLYYLQHLAKERDTSTCTSFVEFKSEYSETKRSQLETVAKRLTAVVDVSGDIQPNKVEYLHVWRWVFFNRVVEDSEEFNEGLFETNADWLEFKKQVKRISFSGNDKGIISLSSLSITLSIPLPAGASAEVKAEMDISRDASRFREFTEIVDKCEELFRKLKRTDVPYYIFVDELEAFYADKDRFIRDLTLIRDLLFTVHMINATEKIRIIAAVRTEITNAMDRFITTNELNKIIAGDTVPIRWSYSNKNLTEHPIIKVLMKRISMATPGEEQDFYDWFPRKVHGVDTIDMILDNGWNRPRDIVRLITSAQNDSLTCNDTKFTAKAFSNFMKEYSKESFDEIKQELQTLYTPEELRIAEKLFMGRPRAVLVDDMKKRLPKSSAARKLWDERGEDIVEDFYRVGIIGNINRTTNPYNWRWQHKGDDGVLTMQPWELVVHAALCKRLSVEYKL